MGEAGAGPKVAEPVFEDEGPSDSAGGGVTAEAEPAPRRPRQRGSERSALSGQLAGLRRRAGLRNVS